MTQRKTKPFLSPGFVVWTVVLLAAASFAAYIALRLVSVASYRQPDFAFYEYDPALSGVPLLLESDSLRFELDPETTQFTLLQKSSGRLWRSSPQNLDGDPIALEKEKNNMRSCLLLEYSTENGNAEVYDFYSNSVKRGFYSVEKKDDAVIVRYTVGQMNREYLFPPMMYQSDFDRWTEGMPRSDVNTVGRAYHRYSMSTATAGDDIAALLRKYPRLKDEDLYLIFENTQNFLKEKLEKIFKEAGFTYEDYLASRELYLESGGKELPAFNATVVYRLEGKRLVVEIPFDEISYRTAFPITRLSVLPYFGAGGSEEEGRILVPEGGGAIINFNNGKIRQNAYYADVYGWDYAQDRKSVVTETKVAFPVFGIASGGSAFISVIEEGASYAGITAEIAGKLGSYNYVRADYRLLHNERYDISARTVNAQYMFEKSLPEGQSLRQVYTFVDGDSVADMAGAYRDSLFAGEQRLPSGRTPLAVEIVGAIDKVQQVAGIPKNLPYTLTTYDEAAAIMHRIGSFGIRGVSYKLSGFINGGVRQKLLKKVRFLGRLGGRPAFARLAAAEGPDDTLYLDGTMQFAWRSSWADGFSRYGSPARFVSQKLCELNEYSAIWYGKDEELPSYYLLRPPLAARSARTLASEAARYGLGVSYRDFGSVLSADYNERRRVSREEAMRMQEAELAGARDKGLPVMLRTGNAYAVQSASFITDLSLTGNSYSILDCSVPFYQMALHGYRNYAGNAVNLAGEMQQELLESAQSAAGLYFTFMAASERAVQETAFTHYYSACFDSWADDFAAIYKDYDAKLGGLAGAVITDFSYLDKDVSRTVFDNGQAVVVNFGYKDYVSRTGAVVPARDYAVLQAED